MDLVVKIVKSRSTIVFPIHLLFHPVSMVVRVSTIWTITLAFVSLHLLEKYVNTKSTSVLQIPVETAALVPTL
jgi:hypothetical protein